MAISESLIEDMEGVFGTDNRRIEHALRVLDYARGILPSEKADVQVVEAAAILHDIGIQQAERKYGSSAGKYQEIEGPPIADAILKKRGMDGGLIEHVCKIIANHHSARDIDTAEFRVVWDADWLVNLQDEGSDMSEEQLRKTIDKVFRTKKGRELAMNVFFGEGCTGAGRKDCE